jgi:hypothetical protein
MMRAMKEINPEGDRPVPKTPESGQGKMDRLDRSATPEHHEKMEQFDDTLTRHREGAETFDDIAGRGSESIEAQRALANDMNDGLHRTFDKYLDSDKRQLNISDKTHFQSNTEYRERLLKKYPDLKEQELAATQGYHDRNEGEIFINSDASKKEAAPTISHEGTHMLSNPEFEQRYGARLNEGLTQHLSRQANPTLELPDYDFHFDKQTRRLDRVTITKTRYYPEEVQAAEMMRTHARLAGEGTLEKAYFKGGSDVDTLAQTLEASTGEKGALDKVSGHLEKAHAYRQDGQSEAADKEYKQCFEILKKRSKLYF